MFLIHVFCSCNFCFLLFWQFKLLVLISWTSYKAETFQCQCKRFCPRSDCSKGAVGVLDYKIFFMHEREILNAHKYKIPRNAASFRLR